MDSFFNNQWTFLPVVAVILLAAAETGFWLGLRLHRMKDDARRTQVGGVQGAVLGLLGLLLAFTFSMGITRYESHRILVLKDANAIRTAWLYARLLPEAQRAPSEDLLRRYVDLRVDYAPVVRDDPAKLEEAIRISHEIEHQLWQQAEAAAKAPNGTTGSFIAAVSDMIDTAAERLDAYRNRIPGGVWVLLLIVASAGCFTSSYGSGSQGARSLFTALFLPILITVVIILIFDLAHSLQGFIGISQQPLIDLRDSMQWKP